MVLHDGVVTQVLYDLRRASTANLVTTVLLLVLGPKVVPVVEAFHAVIDCLGWKCHLLVDDLSWDCHRIVDDMGLGAYFVEVLLNDVLRMHCRDGMLSCIMSSINWMVMSMDMIMSTDMMDFDPRARMVVVTVMAIHPSIMRVCHANESTCGGVMSIVSAIPSIMREVCMNKG